MSGRVALLIGLCLSLLILPQRFAAAQTPDLTLDEARTVYLGNLARRENGLAPLRWNRQLTDAARWFAADSVENRAAGFCGHQDSQGGGPGDRADTFGYRGSAGAENAFCGYVTPEQAIDGWLNSPGHRANLLSPDHREIGLGYYRRASDGRGYVAQMFGADDVYPPVIIENEAISTTSALVRLYVYASLGGGGFGSLGAVRDMQISNDPTFRGANWQPYAAEPTWTLAAGSGWRSVYVRLRDAFNRTATVSDTIYLGANPPAAELGAAQMSTTAAQVTLYGIEGGGLPKVQFSAGWFADDGAASFKLNWGNGAQISDAAALGGTAFRLYPGAGDSNAWVWTTEFPKDLPLVAYARLKTNSTTAGEIGRFSVKGGGTNYGPLVLRGSDFAAANQYQEFPLAFAFGTNPSDSFLEFIFDRTGDADLVIDGVTIFTAPQAIGDPTAWALPGGNYRGQGVWVRYTDGAAQFSPISEGQTSPVGFAVNAQAAAFLAAAGGPAPLPQVLTVALIGHAGGWSAQESASWLSTAVSGDKLSIIVDQSGLAPGVYQQTLAIAPNQPGVDSVSIPVTLRVVNQLASVCVPLAVR